MTEEILSLIIQGKDQLSGALAKASRNLDNFRNSAQKAATKGISELAKAADRGAAQLVKIGTVAAAAVTTGLALFAKGSIDAAAEYEKAVKTLEIVAPRFGVAGDKAVAAAKRLGKELRIGPVAASETLQRLLKSGLNLDQASNLMKRFTNEALTGKSAGMSLAEAVSNLATGYQTEISSLMDRAGISENISTLLEKEARLRNVEISKLDEAGRAQLKYQAFIRLTNETMGSAEKFAGTFIDTQAQLQTKFDEIRVKVGQALLPIMNQLAGVFLSIATVVADNVTPWMSRAIQLVSDLSLGIRHFIEHGDAANDMLWHVAEQLGISSDTFNRFAGFVESARDKIMEFGRFLFGNKENFIEFAKIAGMVAGGLLAIKAAVMAFTVAAPILAFTAVVLGIAFAIMKVKEAWDNNLGGIQDKAKMVFGKIQEVINNLQEPLQKVREYLADAASTIKDNLAKAFDRIKPAIEKLMPKFQKLWEALQPVFKVALALLGALIVIIIEVAKKFTEWLAPAIDMIAENIGNMIDFVTNVINALVGFVNFVVSIPGRISAGIEAIKEFFRNLGQSIRNTLNNMIKINGVGFADWINQQFQRAVAFIDGFKNGAIERFNQFRATVSSVFSTIVDPIKRAFNNAKNFVFGIMNGIRKKIMDTLSGASNVAGSLAGAFKRMLNSLISRINRALEFSFDVLGNKININLPDLPYLAKGVAGFKGGAAVINERGNEAMRIGNTVYMPKGTDVYTARNTEQMQRGDVDNSRKVEIKKIEVKNDEDLKVLLQQLKYIL